MSEMELDPSEPHIDANTSTISASASDAIKGTHTRELGDEPLIDNPSTDIRVSLTSVVRIQITTVTARSTGVRSRVI